PFKMRDFFNEVKRRKSNGGGSGLASAKQIITEKMGAELRMLGFTNEELSKLKLEVMQNILASCCADPVPGFECVPACDLTSPAHRKDVIEFFSLPVEDLGEGITLDSLFPPEEIAALRARGYTDDAIFELTRKQACEILGIETWQRATAQELLEANHIRLKNYNPGKHSTICPQCWDERSRAGQKKKCLSVKIDNDGECWHCNHGGWSGPEKGSGKSSGWKEPEKDQRTAASNVVQLANRHASDGQGDTFVATYDYPDFQKVRYPKGHEPRFLIRHRDPSSNRAGKGWNWGAGSADTSVLYRKDEVDEQIALGRTILVVEGEKDVENLRRIGIPATCNAHGASEPGKKPKWTIEHSEQLRGADIVVLGDHDAAGYAHQDEICKCSLDIAKRVRILKLADHWPEIKEGGDVSDYLDAGHTREQLDALIAKAPDYAPAASGLGEWDAGDEPRAIPPRQWLLGN